MEKLPGVPEGKWRATPRFLLEISIYALGAFLFSSVSEEFIC